MLTLGQGRLEDSELWAEAMFILFLQVRYTLVLFITITVIISPRHSMFPPLLSTISHCHYSAVYAHLAAEIRGALFLGQQYLEWA